jgi:hypothetical protein
VSEMFGHSTITITADTYASVLPDVARRAAESADSADSADSAESLVPRGLHPDLQQPGPIWAPSGPAGDVRLFLG